MLALAVTRDDIANYVSALFEVYIVLIFLYILLNLLFSFGMRPPYSRWTDAVMSFLRDVSRAVPADLPQVHPDDRDVRLQPDDRDHRPVLRADDHRQCDHRLTRLGDDVRLPARPTRPVARPVAFARAGSGGGGR